MHAAGASQGVVNAMLNKYFEMEAAGKAKQVCLDTEFKQKAEADFRKEWGLSYDENVAFANVYLSKSPDFVKLEPYGGSRGGNYPAFIRQMAEFGRLANERRLKFGISRIDVATNMKAQYDQLSRDIQTAY